jgi:hypothetical protein
MYVCILLPSRNAEVKMISVDFPARESKYSQSVAIIVEIVSANKRIFLL